MRIQLRFSKNNYAGKRIFQNIFIFSYLQRMTAIPPLFFLGSNGGGGGGGGDIC